MSRPEIVVTLPADYCARYVTLDVRKCYPLRVWQIVATDSNGWHTPNLQINGVRPHDFKTRRAARERLASLGPFGDHAGRIWATPRERSPRAVVTPAPVSGGYSVGAC